MKLVVQQSQNLEGKVNLPPSKAHSWRALVLASLASGTSIIINPKISSDWAKGVRAMEMFGAKIQSKKNTLLVKGVSKKLRTPEDVIDCGNSGPLLRFLGAIAASCNGYVVFTGDDSIKNSRPVEPLLNGLNQLGAFAVSTRENGHPPIIVGGGLRGGKIVIDGRDSQPVSGLLISCSLRDKDTEIIVKKAGEKLWVGLTIYWMKKVGLKVENVDDKFEHYIVFGGKKIKPFKERIPSDWQSASYPLVAGIITKGSKIEVPNLDNNDPLPDRLVLGALQKMGANIKVKKHSILASYSNLTGIEIDCNDFADQFMALAVAATMAKGTTIIKNVEIQRHKECDRIDAMYKGLKSVGADIIQKNDGLIIRGGKPLTGAVIRGEADHRVVATFATAGLVARGKTVIDDAQFLEKTFGDYVFQMKNIGANFILKNE